MKYFKYILLLIIVTLFLTGCSGNLIAGSSWPGYSTDGEKIYAANSSSVMAINPDNGVRIWTYPAKPDNKTLFYAPPVVSDDAIIVGDYTRTLYSINKNNGNENWSFAAADGKYISSVLVVNELILAPSTDHVLYALDLDGMLKWEFETEQMLWAQPVSDGENAYLASMDHHLYAINLTNGQPVWDKDLESAVVFSIAIDENGILYVGTMSKRMMAIDSNNGKTLWEVSTDEAVWAKPLLVEGNLYFGDLSGKVYSLDSKSGTIKWTNSLPGPVIATAAELPDGLMFVSEEGKAVVMDYEGKQIWEQTIDGKLYSSPVVVGDKIILGVTKGDDALLALDFDGKIVWSSN